MEQNQIGGKDPEWHPWLQQRQRATSDSEQYFLGNALFRESSGSSPGADLTAVPPDVNCINLIQTLPCLVRSKADPENIEQVDDHAFDGATYGLQKSSNGVALSKCGQFDGPSGLDAAAVRIVRLKMA
jgi:hypothetical protein